jgi:hypothetical protein
MEKIDSINKIKKLIIKLMIKTTKYILPENVILTSEILNTYISQFWSEVFAPINDGDHPKHLMILCKVKYYDITESYKTLGPLRRVEFGDQELFCGYLNERLGILYDSYNPSTNVSEINFTYVIKDGIISINDRLLLEDLTDKELPFHNFNKISLPISMNPSDYGNIRSKTQMDGFIRYIVSSNIRIFEIDVILDINKVTILGLSDFKWVDTKISDDSFKREIGKSTLYFLNGEIILQKLQLNAKSFKKTRNGNRFK